VRLDRLTFRVGVGCFQERACIADCLKKEGAPWSGTERMSFWVLFAGALGAELYILRRLRFDTWTLGIVLCGMLLCSRYLLYTTVDERNYDGSSHLEYIQAIGESWRVPDPRACGVCGHPPLYYALGALWSKALSAFHLLPTELGLQLLSLILFGAFAMIAALAIRSQALEPRAARLSLGLVVFWPSSIINSVRVHNDALAQVLLLAALFFLAEWDRGARPKDFLLALAASILAIFTKASGFVVALVLLLFAAREVLAAMGARDRTRCTGATFRLSTAVLAIVFAGWAFSTFHGQNTTEPGCHSVFGSACGGRYVPPVSDALGHFFRFEPVAFLQSTDTVPSDSFPNRFLHSSLFGVMPLGEELTGRGLNLCAVVMKTLLLTMLPVTCFLVRFWGRLRSSGSRVYAVASVVLFGALVAFRVQVPNEFHEDFRHIYPVLVPSSFGYFALASNIGRVSRTGRLLMEAIAVSMIAASAVFFGLPS
jgi:hypothetical protein